MKKKIWTRVLIILLTIVTFGYAALSYYMMQVVTEPKADNFDSIKEKLATKYDVVLDEIPMEKTKVTTSDGMELETVVYKNPNPTGKVIVLSHGVRQNAQEMFTFFPMYQALGFDIVSFSYRNHGQSTKSFTTFGLNEVRDLDAIMKFAHTTFGESVTYGIHGVSMGAGIMLRYASQSASQPLYQYLISDCSFADFEELLNTRLDEDYPPLSFLPLVESANIISKMIGRGDLGQVKPREDVRNIKAPVLFVHGKKDAYIPEYHVQELYNAKTGEKALFEVEEAPHAESYLYDRTGYEQKFQAFYDTYITKVN